MTIRRRYPEAPVAAVGAIIIDCDHFLLIRRGQEPQKGEWSLPGGAVELGETLEEALRREVLEETGLVVEPVRILKILDRISRDSNGRVMYHYVLVDYQCTVTGGLLCCASDAAEARWLQKDQLGLIGLAPLIVQVIRSAFDE